MALAASRLAQRPAMPEKTYGFYRTEILAVLANGILLFGWRGSSSYEAWRRAGAHGVSSDRAGPRPAATIREAVDL